MNNITITNPYGFIYITTNMVNGKKYIGQKKFENGNHSTRWKTYKGSGKAFKEALKKYGDDNFFVDIIQVAYSKDELDSLEIKTISFFNATTSNDFYNICSGGHTGNPYEGKTESELNLIKQKQSSKRKGRKLTDEWKTNISKSVNERYKDKNQRMKSSRPGMLNPNYGNHILKGTSWGSHTEKTKKHLSEIRNGEKNPASKKIICKNDEKVFTTIKEAGEYYNVDNSCISKVCKGKLKHTKGFVFKYYD